MDKISVPEEVSCPRCHKSNRDGNCTCYDSGEFWELQRKLKAAEIEIQRGQIRERILIKRGDDFADGAIELAAQLEAATKELERVNKELELAKTELQEAKKNIKRAESHYKLMQEILGNPNSVLVGVQELQKKLADTIKFGDECIAAHVVREKELDANIEKAMSYIEKHGGEDETHHLRWVIDQVVRALKACPMVTYTKGSAQGSYKYDAQGESERYKEWVAMMTTGDNEDYDWDVGIAP